MNKIHGHCIIERTYLHERNHVFKQNLRLRHPS